MCQAKAILDTISVNPKQSLMQYLSGQINLRYNIKQSKVQYNEQFILHRISDKIVTQRHFPKIHELNGKINFWGGGGFF